jgi:peptidyl-prolyl cis-trans isomerase A (cyclophilin A)
MVAIPWLNNNFTPLRINQTVMKLPFFISILLLAAGCSHPKNSEPHIIIETSLGTIEAELYPSKAPKTVAAFLSYVKQGLYDGSSFYRVLKNEGLAPEYNSGLIQGGIYKSNPAQLSKLQGTPHESPRETGLSHVSGTLSLARTLPGTGRSEFFICIGDQLQFDSSRRTNPDGLGYAAFGKVIDGMPIVRKIQAKENNGEDILDPVKIIKIEVQ